jgi:hypothetical protein
MHVRGLAIAAIAFIDCFDTAAVAEDKGRYNLFSPVPERLMRDMTTDRPDTTETPFTIDAGHIQAEGDFFRFARSHRDADGAFTDSYEIAPMNVRVGVTNDAEVSLAWRPHGSVLTRASAQPIPRAAGVGALDIGMKINLWGNDDFEQRGSAFALLPFVTVPTEPGNGISSEHLEAGLVVPFAVALTERAGLGVNGGVAYRKDADTEAAYAEYLGTAAVDYEWTSRFGTYAEVVGLVSEGSHGTDLAYVGVGFTYAVTPNLQVDGGINFGLTDEADRIAPFVGFAARH